MQAIYLPSDLHDWISEVVVKDNAKLFYETDKKTKLRIGICSYCKAKVTVNEASHNNSGMCPSCSSTVQFKAIHKAKFYGDNDYFAFIQRLDTGIMVRRFELKLIYKSQNKTTSVESIEILLNEVSRSVLEGDNRRSVHFEFGEFKRLEYRWKKEEQRMGYYESGAASRARNSFMRVYHRNLKEVIEGTKWERCAIELIKNKIDPSDYFEFEESDLLEMVMRRGLHHLASDMVNGNYQTRSSDLKIRLSKNMGFSEYMIFMLKKYDLGIRDLEIIRTLEIVRNIKVTYDQMLWLKENFSEFARLVNLLEYSNLQKAINYIEKKAKDGNISVTRTITEWSDYIEGATKLGYNLGDMIIVYPRDLGKAHDDVVSRIKDNENKEINIGIKKIAKKFSRLNFKNKILVMKIVTSQRDILTESRVLGHCVGRLGYAKRMSEGKTLIATIRKLEKPNEPYFTIEIDPITLEIKQYESKDRISNSKDINEFLKDWKTHLLKETKESKKIKNTRRIEHEQRIAN